MIDWIFSLSSSYFTQESVLVQDSVCVEFGCIQARLTTTMASHNNELPFLSQLVGKETEAQRMSVMWEKPEIETQHGDPWEVTLWSLHWGQFSSTNMFCFEHRGCARICVLCQGLGNGSDPGTILPYSLVVLTQSAQKELVVGPHVTVESPAKSLTQPKHHHLCSCNQLMISSFHD